jgi:hypothetical protein
VTLERTCLMDPLPAEESAFATRREAARGRILLVAQEILRLLGGPILAEHAALAKKLASAMQKAFPQAAADIGAQLAELMPKRSSSPRPSSACSTIRATSRRSPCASTRRAATRRATRG